MASQTFKNLLPKFIDDLSAKGRSPSTILAYRADLDQLITFLHGKSKVLIDQVLSSDLESFRDTLLAEKYTPKSVSRKLSGIKSKWGMPS